MSDRRTPTEAELAALADGSLSTERREQLLAQVRRSPQLIDALAVQQRAVRLTRAVDVSAPASLHERIRRLHSEPPPRRRTVAWPVAFGGALAAAAAATVAALLIALGPSAPRAPTLAQISTLALSAATSPVPAESSRSGELAVSVQGVSFPYWGARLGWHSTGQRFDRLARTSVTTVFYENQRHLRVGYAILAGPAPPSDGGSVVWRGGVPFTLRRVNGAPTVTWSRAGHLCVISGRAVSNQTLLELASWRAARSAA